MLTNHKGTSQHEWWLANGTVKVVNNSGVIEVQDSSGEVIVFRSAGIPDSSPTLEDVAVYHDIQDLAPTMAFSFSGVAAPSAGSNTNTYGFCHTTGTSYTEGKIYYDDGITIYERPHVRIIVTDSAISGNVSLNANGIYVLDGSTWTLKGDGNSGGGSGASAIKVTFAYDNTTPTSTTTIPDDYDIYKINLVITTPFTGGTSPTVAAATDGSSSKSLILTSDFDITQGEQYGIDDIIELGTNEGGHIDITVTPDGASAGAGYVYIMYAQASN